MPFAQDKIENIRPAIPEARQKLNEAIRELNFAKKILAIGGKEIDLIFTHVYDAILKSSTAWLWFNGYRVRTGSSHHFVTMNMASYLFPDKLHNEYIRAQKFRAKRNKITYGIFEEMPEADLRQALVDAELIISTIDKIILEQERQQKMI